MELVFESETQRPTTVEITLSVLDSETGGFGNWVSPFFKPIVGVNLHLKLADVKEFSFCERPDTCNIVLYELHIAHFEGLFFLGFGGPGDSPSTIADFRQSEFYFAARQVQWEVGPYPASNPELGHVPDSTVQ